MDPHRRELYVEGTRDRLFLRWVFRESIELATVVREIAFVDISAADGGERGRLVAFARWLADSPVEIRCFADADFDRLLGHSVPARLWLTDGKDLEGYVLRLECLDKVLKLGVGTDTVTPEDLLRSVREHGRRLGILRLLSELQGLRLPFQATRLHRYLVCEAGALIVQWDRYLTALLQNAQISLTQLPTIQAELLSLEQEVTSVADSQLIHGKDAFCLIYALLARFDVEEKEVARLLWTSFETRYVDVDSHLAMVGQFLAAQAGRISARLSCAEACYRRLRGLAAA